MIAYHGTTKKGLSVLTPFANPESTLKYSCVYLTTYEPLAAIYIWDRPYKWMNYGFAEDGLPVYTESFPHALAEFYKGLSGCIYSCNGAFEYDTKEKIKVAVVSKTDVPVHCTKEILDCHTQLLTYEYQGLLHINRFETLTDAQRSSQANMILSMIKQRNLLASQEPLAAFIKEKLPEIWMQAEKMSNSLDSCDIK